MIELNFGLFHSGPPMSYLRYLTFKTLRHFHPHSRIQLFISKHCKTDGHAWGVEKQDFENPDCFKIDHIDQLDELDVEIIHMDHFGKQYHPNFQSDIFRWWWLKNNGGFYLDTDQIILKSFEGLPLNNKIMYCAYKAVTCGVYTPVGAIGAQKDSKIVNHIVKYIPDYHNPNVYNSLGPFMFRDVMAKKDWQEGLNMPSKWFYPVPESCFVSKIFDGSFKIPEESYSLHWFGGHPLSQEFNKKYIEEFVDTSNDTISRFLKEKGIR